MGNLNPVEASFRNRRYAEQIDSGNRQDLRAVPSHIAAKH
jgi:hypothetical protein